MFDIGFSELILVFIVGLVVLGPKRLPHAIRTVMGWVKTIRGLAANVQNELAQELKLQELQENIKKAEQFNLSQLSPELSKTVEELKQSAQKIREDLEQKAKETNTTFVDQIQELKKTVEQEPTSAATELETTTPSSTPATSSDVESSKIDESSKIEKPSKVDEANKIDETEMTRIAQNYYPIDDETTVAEPTNSANK